MTFGRKPIPSATIPTRMAGLIFGALLLLGAVPRDIRAAEPQAAADFVQAVSNQAIQILRQQRGDAQRETAFQNLMQRNVDLPRVARFTLAKYWRQSSDQQKQEFQNLFQVYMVRIYSSRLDQYSGETVKITGATPQSESQTVVHSEITRPSGEQPVKVDWIVRQDTSGMKLVDLVVEGASMAITQRSEFNSIIENNGGNVDALLQRMRQIVSQAPA